MLQQDSLNASAKKVSDPSVVKNDRSVVSIANSDSDVARRRQKNPDSVRITQKQIEVSQDTTVPISTSAILPQDSISVAKNEWFSAINFLSDSTFFSHGSEWWKFDSSKFGFGVAKDSTSKISTYNNASTTSRKEYSGTPKPFSLEKEDGIFALIFVCFLLMSIVYKLGTPLFKRRKIYNFLTPSSDSGFYSETTNYDAWGNSFLFFLSTFIFSIVLYTHFVYTNPANGANISLLTIGGFVILISLVELLKNSFYMLVGVLFETSRAMNVWRNDYKAINYTFGISCFLPALFLVYSDNYHNIAFIIVSILFILTRILFFYRISVYFLQQNVNFLFLIVYLCSVEILPYIILYVGMDFIYKTDIISIL